MLTGVRSIASLMLENAAAIARNFSSFEMESDEFNLSNSRPTASTVLSTALIHFAKHWSAAESMLHS